MDADSKRVQLVPIVHYTDTERIVIGEAVITGDVIEYNFFDDMRPEVRELLRDHPTSYSAAEVLNKDTPLFPANAYQVNEPLASARLIDAVLNIPTFKITEE